MIHKGRGEAKKKCKDYKPTVLWHLFSNIQSLEDLYVLGNCQLTLDTR